MSGKPPASNTLLGIGLMLAAMAILPFLDVCAKFLGRQGMPILEIVWARMTFGAVITLPFAMRAGGRISLRPSIPLYHVARSAFLIAATGFFFLGLRYLSIADTLSIFFVQPLVVTALSPLVLGETVGARRWVAVVIGFIGTLIIIRPGLQALNPGVIFALAAGFSIAIYMLMTRRIAGRAPAMVTTFHTNLAGAVLTSAAVIFVWQWPQVHQWILFGTLALIAAFGHYLIVRAYDYCEASLLAPLAYSEMIMATAAGWWFFDDFPDRWTFVGVGILIACAIYISLAEQSKLALVERDFEQP
jgi:drug/metabolite transporter (DMT)-like permease